MRRKIALGALSFLAVILFFAGTTIVSVLNGGTGVSNPAQYSLPVGEGSSAMHFLTGSGCPVFSLAADPTFGACPGAGGGGFAWGGSGYDGAVTADGSTSYNCLGSPGTHNGIATSYLMVTDCNTTTFTVNSGVTVLFQQTRIFATQSITINGTLRASATNGGNGTAGSNTGGAGSGGAAPSADNALGYFNAPVGCLWSGSSTCSNSLYVAGANGGAGSSSTGSGGGLGSAGGNTNFEICPSNSVAGVAGGNGGHGTVGSGGSGGTGGVHGTCSLNPGSYYALSLPGALMWGLTAGNGTYSNIGYIPYNGQGGGGGGGSGDGTNSGGGGGGAGASGGNGNQIILVAPTITVGASGILDADGSAGGSGGNGGSPTTGNAGGGGGGAGGTGGNGGVIVLVYHQYSNAGSVHANAGSGGTGGTGGTAVGSGINGGGGPNGNNGLAGLIVQITQ